MEQSNTSVRQSQIAYNIQELENTTKLLVDAVNQHKARLSMVLKPPIPDIKQKTEVTEDKAALVPLAEKLHTLNLILSNILSEISEIEQRLEL